MYEYPTPGPHCETNTSIEVLSALLKFADKFVISPITHSLDKSLNILLEEKMLIGWFLKEIKLALCSILLSALSNLLQSLFVSPTPKFWYLT